MHFCTFLSCVKRGEGNAGGGMDEKEGRGRDREQIRVFASTVKLVQENVLNSSAGDMIPSCVS